MGAETPGARPTLLRRLVETCAGPLTRKNGLAWLAVIILVLVIRWLFFESFSIPTGSMEPTLHGDLRWFRGDRVGVNKLIYGPRAPFTTKRIFKIYEPRRWDIVVFKNPDPKGEHGTLVKRVVGLPGERIQIKDGKIWVNGRPVEPPEPLRNVLNYTRELHGNETEVQRLAIHMAATQTRDPALNPANPDVQKLYDELKGLREKLGDIRLAEVDAETAQRLYETLSPGTRGILAQLYVRRIRELCPLRYGILPEDEFSVVPEDCYLVCGDNSGESVDGRYFGWLPNGHIIGRVSCIYWPIGRRRDFTGFTRTWWGIAFLYGVPAGVIALETRALWRRRRRRAMPPPLQGPYRDRRLGERGPLFAFLAELRNNPFFYRPFLQDNRMVKTKTTADQRRENFWTRFRRTLTCEWIKSLSIAVGLALIIRWTVAEPFRIPSGSMEPTFIGDPRLLRGDRVFVNKFIYGWRYPLNGTRIPFTKIRVNYASERLWRGQDPKRWDIVVFKAVEQNAIHTTLVKRVVGMPGERIHIANGKVYVNEEPLTLPPDMPPVVYTTPMHSEAKYGILPDDAYSLVPPDHYLLLGDNSSNSRDGRYFGWVSNERILGRVSCIWWPPGRWRDFTGFSDTWWWKTTVILVLGLLFVRVFLGRSWRHRTTPADHKPAYVHYYIDRLAYGLPIPFTRRRLITWRTPDRQDLVLFVNPKPAKDRPALLFGRVVGLPGERIALGKRNVQVSPAGYFILADNLDKDEPADSRTLGAVPLSHIIGKARFIWWPVTRWRPAPASRPAR